MANTRRIFLIWNPEKPDAARARDELRPFLAALATIVGEATTPDGHGIHVGDVDRVVVLGGDGTLLGAGRSLGGQQVPVIGVNAGKLGFLAEFSVEEFKHEFDRAVSDDSLVSRRLMLHVDIRRDGTNLASSLAINDCVVQAGPPFRMITLGILLDGEPLTNIAGDGIILSTPSGSTAHNLSAGGPIMQPDVDAIIMTPLAPHSLTHKPLVVAPDSNIEIRADAVNEGTTVIFDGQVPFPLRGGDRIVAKRAPGDFLLVCNPRHARWQKLTNKLHWGRSPSNG